MRIFTNDLLVTFIFIENIDSLKNVDSLKQNSFFIIFTISLNMSSQYIIHYPRIKMHKSIQNMKIIF